MIQLRRTIVMMAFVALSGLLAACSDAESVAGPTDTPEPIVPTRTPQPVINTTTATVELEPSATPFPPTIAPTATPVPPEVSISPAELARFGVAGPLEHARPAAEAGLPFGSFLNWRTNPEPAVPPGTTFWQMLRLSEEGISPDWDEIEMVISAQPGSVWLVGNEPDVPWQDGITAERYAELYHKAYAFIKTRDPSAVVGAGGIAMPSPLRFVYLDTVLREYESRYGEPMPVDLWSVHAFTLREERDSWGIGIPPGSEESAGELFEIEDHGDVELFKAHIRDFRQWLADNGYRDVPLAVTEFGILLPADYGFPEEFVIDYLQQTMEFMRTAADETTGLSSDANRLVQFWFWYSLDDSGAYPTGDLFDPATNTLSPLGEALRDYVLSIAD